MALKVSLHLSPVLAKGICGCAAAMYAAMAAPSNKGDQPKATSNGVIGFLFYIAFIVICAFCLLNLYVGVIFSEFSKIRLLSTAGSAFLTTKQQVCALQRACGHDVHCNPGFDTYICTFVH